jgi:hypothetical protein
MLGTNKAAVLGVWALTVAAAFAVGRSTAPAGSDPAPENLATAIQAALGEPDVLDRAERTARLLQGLNRDNVTEVAEVYYRRLNILGELAIRPFIAAWARFDPEAALKHTLRWPYRDKKEIGIGAAIEAWALRDPTGALETYERLMESNPRLDDLLFFDMLTGWVYSGHEGVDDYIANLSVGKLDDSISRVAAKTLRNGGVDALLRWVNGITGNEDYTVKFKKKAFQRGSRMIARWDPERAAAWVMENRGQNYAYDGPRIVAEQWGAQDGRAALEWVRNHPDEKPRHEAAREAFLAWFESDRASAVEWLEAEELTAFHDPAIVLYSKKIAPRTPTEAIEWCERVFDEQRRLGCLKKAAIQWYKRDAVAAETWLQQSPLDEDARYKVRTPRKKRRQQQRQNLQRP